jgi:hypothetical protein
MEDAMAQHIVVVLQSIHIEYASVLTPEQEKYGSALELSHMTAIMGKSSKTIMMITKKWLLQLRTLDHESHTGILNAVKEIFCQVMQYFVDAKEEGFAKPWLKDQEANS